MDMADLNDKQLLRAVFEEVGNIKEEITGFKIEVNEKFDEMREEMNEKFDGVNEKFDGVNDQFESQNEKLDKILAVVSENIASHHKRIKRIESHLGLQTLM